MVQPDSPESLGGPARRIAIATGIHLQYVEYGDPCGPVLIFLHGFTDSWCTWAHILPRVSSAYHAYALSQRGHGDSDKPACCYRVSDYVDDLRAFMDALHITQATIIGHSMGSYIAFQFAADYAERVEHLVLIGLGPIRPTSLAAVERVIRLNSAVQSWDDRSDPVLIRAFITSCVVNPLPAADLETMVAESLKVPVVVWQQMLASRLAADPSPPCGPIKAKTLVVYGDHDVYVREGQQVLADVLPHARLFVYPATGHAVQWDAPRAS
jgi:pimeloyl-ACP methyl ester carboxylesterase